MARRYRPAAVPVEDDIRLAYATCDALPFGDEDFEPVSRLLGGVGCDAVPWDNQVVDWDRFDLVVVRSTWDWSDRPQEFLSWVHSLGRVANPAEVIEWNHDKRYLGALHASGLPVAPTRWDPAELPPGRWVVKPTVSAGARNTIAGDREQALAHVEALHAMGRRAMVQPYLDAVDEHGETALVYLDGELSHAVRTRARLGLAKEDERIAPHTPTVEELEVAGEVLDRMPFDAGSMLYARVDLVPDADGDPLLLELELIEPSLFLTAADGAAERFARAILRRF
jgi:hypothetical protein